VSVQFWKKLKKCVFLRLTPFFLKGYFFETQFLRIDFRPKQ
jgi:hypothetical protein